MLVPVDQTREHQQSLAVYDLNRVINLKAMADCGNALAGHQDVCAFQLPVALVEGDQVADVANQSVWHLLRVSPLGR